MTPELYQFFVSYRAWLDVGAPDVRPYSRFWGLCGNCIVSHRLQYSELEEILNSEFGNAYAPFGRLLFYKEARKKTQHLNPDRIAFVDRMITKHAPKMEGVV